jgi:hypothetical protein
MNLPVARGAIHRDWLRPRRTVESAPTSRFLSGVEVASRGRADKVTPLVDQARTETRPYSDDAARAMSWVLPPEPRDADEASRQINDYFDAVAAMVRRLEEQHIDK